MAISRPRKRQISRQDSYLLSFRLLLLQRSDIDTSLKDYEGYTAFDLYNSTVSGTKPTDGAPTDDYELFTWGVNRRDIVFSVIWLY